MGRPGTGPTAAGVAWAWVFATGLAPALGASPGDKAPGGEVARGREIFFREWVANDPRSHGGDGLGPMFNDTSCVACHALGGPGGAGPAGKNALILTASPNLGQGQMISGGMPGQGTPADGRPAPGRPDQSPADDATDALAKVHAGFRDARSIVLHRQSTRDSYDAWVSGLFGRAGFDELTRLAAAVGQPDDRVQRRTVARTGRRAVQQLKSDKFKGQTLTVSERNTPPLFGAGLIDAVRERDLRAVAEAQPEAIRGRPRALPGGGVGRFGWKAQTATLREFVYAACASEIGLEVPRHHQATTPEGPVVPDGYDLDRDDCEALVAYVANVPVPSRAGGSERIPDVAEGGRLFKEVGCAGCHTPDLGPARAIYSDLLLHDMGRSLSDAGGSYGGPSSPGFSAGSDRAIAATDQEWRTPPLWGVRDSAPYLHDGRADTLEEAISLHAGQAATTAGRYQGLTPGGRRHLIAFLKSLVAPEPGAPGPDLAAAVAAAEAPAPEARRPTDLARDQRRKLRAGQALERIGRADDALVLYREAVRIKPGTDAALDAFARLAAMSAGNAPKR